MPGACRLGASNYFRRYSNYRKLKLGGQIETATVSSESPGYIQFFLTFLAAQLYHTLRRPGARSHPGFSC